VSVHRLRLFALFPRAVEKGSTASARDEVPPFSTLSAGRFNFSQPLSKLPRGINLSVCRCPSVRETFRFTVFSTGQGLAEAHFRYRGILTKSLAFLGENKRCQSTDLDERTRPFSVCRAGAISHTQPDARRHERPIATFHRLINMLQTQPGLLPFAAVAKSRRLGKTNVLPIGWELATDQSAGTADCGLHSFMTHHAQPDHLLA